MLRIFSRIRHTLIGSSSGRYFLYALGEIALVVIGILLALQINNWNEWRKNRESEFVLLVELRENLTENIAILESSLEQNNRRALEIDTIQYYLKTNSVFSDSLGKLLFRLYYIDEFSLLSSAYQSMKSMGVDILNSNELKKQIINLYEFLYAREMKLIDNVDYGRSQSDSEFFITLFSIGTGIFYPNDYATLRDNQLFHNHISARKSWKLNKVYHIQLILEKTLELKGLVEKELEKW